MWADWCAATGRTSLDVGAAALDAYSRQVKTPRLSDIRATCRDVGLPWPYETDPDPWTGREAGLDAGLARCPVYGWPDGFRGRRDAWLIVLTVGLRMTRSDALAVSVPDLPGVWARLEAGEHPATCRRCAVSRWLEVVAVSDHWSWRVTREVLLTRPGDPSAHVCTDGLPAVPDVLGPEALAPHIDRYGQVTYGAPLTPRSVTGVLATRCAAGGGPPATTVPSPDVADRAPGRVFDETTFTRLDEACLVADEVNARVAALLEAVEEQLGQSAYASASASPDKK